LNLQNGKEGKVEQMEPIRTRYAKNGDINVAYQVFGEGDVDLVFVPGFISHIENYWDEPRLAQWLRRLGSFCRVIMFDKQGTGLSDRSSKLPNMDERMDDVSAVMDAVGIEQAALFGISEGGSLATLFAASHPERSQALILYGAFAQFTSWFPTQEALEGLFQYIGSAWGSGESLPMFAPTMKDDLALKEWWGKFERLGASPGAAETIMRMNSQIDIIDILPSVKVPTLVIHRRDDVTVNVEGGRLLAERIPNAKYVELPGVDHLPMVGENPNQILDEMAQFLTGEFRPIETECILCTVLFTDIVDSTKRAAELGDRQWRDLLERHHNLVRGELNRFRGQEVDTAGDGFFASFDGPARAIRCACAIRDSVSSLGIAIRAGLHTGECEVMEDKISGIAVHIGARVMGKADPGEVLVSGTVKDLVAGSGLHFSDRGKYDLKGIPGEWRIFLVEHSM
jgi:pimeloyl-ACP methyl ester carboxylesterase/class 3 adenylate cyclase